MTLSELHQGTQSFLEGDWLLLLTANPWYWLAVLCLVCVVAFDGVHRMPAWVVRPCGVLLAGYGMLTLMFLLPVEDTWVRAHGELARKAAAHLNWSKADPASFTRFDAFMLLRRMEDDERSANALVAKIARAGGDAHAAEPVVMEALSQVHKGK